MRPRGGRRRRAACSDTRSRRTRRGLKVLLVTGLSIAAMGSPDAQATACPTGSQYSTAITGTTGLVGYWRLDDSAALAACDALNLNPGTYAGGVTVLQAGALAGDTDAAARFNGSAGKGPIPSRTAPPPRHTLPG